MKIAHLNRGRQNTDRDPPTPFAGPSPSPYWKNVPHPSPAFVATYSKKWRYAEKALIIHQEWCTSLDKIPWLFCNRTTEACSLISIPCCKNPGCYPQCNGIFLFIQFGPHPAPPRERPLYGGHVAALSRHIFRGSSRLSLLPAATRRCGRLARPGRPAHRRLRQLDHLPDQRHPLH